MISIKDGNIQVEGSLGNLIMEAARIIDSVASTIDNKSGEDEIDYDFVLHAILEYVAQMSKINHKDNTWNDEEEIRFYQAAQKLRKEYQDGDDFIDFDSGTQAPKKGKSSYGKKLKDTTNISGGMKLVGDDDFYIDPRLSKDDLVDINDLKARKKGK